MISSVSLPKSSLPVASTAAVEKALITTVAAPTVQQPEVKPSVQTTETLPMPSSQTLLAQVTGSAVPPSPAPTVKETPAVKQTPANPNPSSNPLTLLQNLLPSTNSSALELTKILTLDELRKLAAIQANPDLVKDMSIADFKALVEIMAKLPPSYFLPSDQKQFLEAIGPINEKLQTLGLDKLNTPEGKAVLAQIDSLLGKLTNDSKAVDASIKAMQEAFAKATNSDERERLRGLIAQAEDLKARLEQSRAVLRNLLQASRGGAGEWADAKQRLQDYIKGLNDTGTSNQNMLKIVAANDGSYKSQLLDPRLNLWKKLKVNQFIDSFLKGQAPVIATTTSSTTR